MPPPTAFPTVEPESETDGFLVVVAAVVFVLVGPAVAVSAVVKVPLPAATRWAPAVFLATELTAITTVFPAGNAIDGVNTRTLSFSAHPIVPRTGLPPAMTENPRAVLRRSKIG